jgi:hypothetical protein
MKEMCFYNDFHNGDVHLSRGLVRYIVKERPSLKYSYIHGCNADLLSDIENVTLVQDRSALDLICKHRYEWGFSIDEILYVNTWYGSCEHRNMHKYGLTFDCLLNVLNDITSHTLDLDLRTVDAKILFPWIDFSKYQIQQATGKLSGIAKPMVMVANNLALSGQAENFSFNPVIDTLSDRYPNVLFVVTNKIDPVNKQNVMYVSDIVGKNGFDLNELAYVSTYCSVIVGRPSGPFSFALNRVNMFDRTCDMLSISNLQNSDEFWIGPMLSGKLRYSGICKNYNTNDMSVIIKMVDELIQKNL